MKAAQVLERLAAHGKTLAVAESFTGGLVLEGLTDIPGASRVVRGGVVCYSAESKSDLLGIRASSLVQAGPVSETVAREMAEAARARFRTDYGLSTTGVAGPTGDSPNDPIGTSIVAVASGAGTRVARVVHPGTRAQAREAAFDQALAELAGVLREEGIL